MSDITVSTDEDGGTMTISRPRMISPFHGYPMDNIPDGLKYNIMLLKATNKLKAFDLHQNDNIELVIEYYAECYVNCHDPEKKKDIIDIILFLCQRRAEIREYNDLTTTHIN